MSTLESLICRALDACDVDVLHIASDGVRVRAPDGTEADLGFSNLRRLLAMAPPDRWSAIVEERVDLFLEALQPLERSGSDLQHLLPRLAIPGGPAMGTPWTHTLVPEHLAMALSIDRPGSVRLLKPLDVVGLGVGVASAMERAIGNLRSRTSASPAQPIADGIFEVAVGDGYDAARVLLAAEWYPDGVFATMPARDVLRVVPVVSGKSLALAGTLWQTTQPELRVLPYPLSPDLFWVHAGGMEVVAVRRTETGEIAVQPPDALRGSWGH